MAYRELKQLNRLQLLFLESVELMIFCDRWKLILNNWLNNIAKIRHFKFYFFKYTGKTTTLQNI